MAIYKNSRILINRMRKQPPPVVIAAQSPEEELKAKINQQEEEEQRRQDAIRNEIKKQQKPLIEGNPPRKSRQF